MTRSDDEIEAAPDETADAWKRAVDAVDTLAPAISAARIETFLKIYSSRCLDNVTERKIVASALAEWLAGNDPVRPLAKSMAPVFATVAAWVLTDEPGIDLIEVACESHGLDADELSELTGVDRELFRERYEGDKPT